MADTDSSAASCSKKEAKKCFRWDLNLVQNLVECLLEYKSKMEYRSLDFDADKPMQYKEIRLMMAMLFEEEDVSLFGPIAPVALPGNFENLTGVEKEKANKSVKDAKDLITRGQKRVMEKVKEIRQNFSKAVVAGSRSGSGKFVYELYDKLIQLWGGSANTEPLPYGVNVDSFAAFADNARDGSSSLQGIAATPGGAVESYSEESNQDDDDELNEVTPNRKRKQSCVPKLIDNKRKHLEKSLSAAQRDQLLIKEAKEDAQFRRDLAEAMRQSTESFAQSIKDVSKAMADLGAGVCRSIEMLSRAMQQPNVPPVNQNLFYQNSHQSSRHGQEVFHQMMNQMNDDNYETGWQ